MSRNGSGNPYTFQRCASLLVAAAHSGMRTARIQFGLAAYDLANLYTSVAGRKLNYLDLYLASKHWSEL